MGEGSWAVCASEVGGRARPGSALAEPVVLPYDRQHGAGTPGLELFEGLLQDSSGTPDAPAAAVVETAQGEGGMYTATSDWLQRLAGLCKRHGVLLIVDDVQMGCGRTRPFFSL